MQWPPNPCPLQVHLNVLFWRMFWKHNQIVSLFCSVASSGFPPPEGENQEPCSGLCGPPWSTHTFLASSHFVHSPLAIITFGWALSSQTWACLGFWPVPPLRRMCLSQMFRHQPGEAIPDVILYKSYLLTLAHPALFPFKALTLFDTHIFTYLSVHFLPQPECDVYKGRVHLFLWHLMQHQNFRTQ